ncbi:MAG: hypothetical protein GXY83_37515 [Rhodopirellula sp.]|nr:hypothetical protein [Rhodopirellula sp.]
MNTRQLLIAALEGETPSRTPLAVYDWCMGAITTDEVKNKICQPAWQRLIQRGLTIRHHCPITSAIEHGVQHSVEELRQGNGMRRVEIKQTPVGTLRKTSRNGWHEEHWIKTPADYEIQQWIVENTELTPNYGAFDAAEEAVGENGVVVVTGAGNWMHRTPAMSINVDWAGTEQFCLDLGLELPELFDLYAAQRKLFLEEQRLIAAGPGRYVGWFENLTINMLGPRRYDGLLMPIYREATPIHEAAGKRVMVHYDGALKAVADHIAGAPFHIIDSLTEPPEGDMTYDQCRAAWPDKVFWANVNVDLYYRPADELREAVRGICRRAGKRGVALEISEDLPGNWEQSVPVVLETLEELCS